MNQDQQVEEILRKAAILQAASHIQFNPGYDPSAREIVLNHKVSEQLNKLGGKLIVQNGEPKLVSAANPELELYNQNQQKLTLRSVIDQSLEGMGNSFYTPSTPASLATDPAVNPLTGETSWYDAQGNQHVKIGNSEYVFPAYQTRAPSTKEEQVAYFNKKLGINP